MLRYIWLVILSFVSLIFLTQYSKAAEINSNNYTIYSGDINNDGLKDFVFSAKRYFLILHGDIATPMQFAKDIDLVIYRDGVGYSSPVALALTPAEIAAKVSAGTLKLAQENTDYFIWKNGTSTQSNLLLRGTDSTAPALLLSSYANTLFPSIAQVYSPERFEGISTSTVKLTITDYNGDGRKDILLEDQTAAAWKTVYIANSTAVPITYTQVAASTLTPVITPVATPTEPAVLAGATPYTADVNQKGAATISVPIKVPQGLNGMQPRLSLNYNSGGTAADKNTQSAAGVLGFGWSLSGLSEIRRCTVGKADLYQTVDPYNAQSGLKLYRPWLNYNATDSLCLDGQLLILVSGVHFQKNAIYRTYKESFKRIILYGEGNDIWFRVENPNGSIAHYGLNSNSRVQKELSLDSLQKTAPFIWGVEYEEDRAGNQITYNYAKNERYSAHANFTRLLPINIDYNQNIGNSLHKYSITFEYTPVPPGGPYYYLNTYDINYPSGVLDRFSFARQASAQLNKIKINRGADELEYRIEGTGQSNDEMRSAGLKVEKITECYTRASTSRCLKPLIFNWKQYVVSPPMVEGVPTSTYNVAQHHLNNMVDSLGAVTKFDFFTDFDVYFYEHPFVVPSGSPLTWPVVVENGGLIYSGYEPSKIYVVTKLQRSTAIAPDTFQTTSYRYLASSYAQPGSSIMETHVGAFNSSFGLGFLGFKAIRVTDETTGIVTYNQYAAGNLIGKDVLLDHTQTASYKYDGIYGLVGTKPISKREVWNETKLIPQGGGESTRLPTVKQITNYSYENGQLSGVSIKNNNYTITNGFVAKIVSTESNGSALEVSPYIPTRNWGQTALYNLTASSTKNTRVTTTTLGDVIRDPGYYTSTAHMNLETNWYIGAVTKKVEQFYNGAATSGNYTDTKVQTADYKYESPLMKLTEVKRFAGDPENELTEIYGYDTNGHQTSITTKGANIDERISLAGFPLLATASYIAPSSITNALGHVIINSNFDRRHDQPQTVTDANGLATTQEFDSLGRLLATTDSNGVKTTQAYISCETVSCATVAGKLSVITPSYFKEVVSPINPKYREYYDSLGRVIRAETQGFNAGEWIRTDTQYDERGRIYKVSLPYKAGNTPQYSINAYDKFNRLTNVTSADGGSVQTVYEAVTGEDGYMQLRTTTKEFIKKADGVADAGSQQKASYTNSAGQLIKTTDSAGVITSFEYDALGNISKTTVNGGADGITVSSASFDNAGNRTSITDPNAGTIQSKYTALGQLRWMKDNKGSETIFTYDKLGRTLTRTSVDGTSNWFYDPVGAMGNLWYTTNNNGYKQTYFYEDNYRAARLSRIETNISVPEIGLSDKTYTDYIKYDIYGRVQKTVSPSGFSAIQNYNAQGYPSSLYRGDTMSALQTTAQWGAFGIEQESLVDGSVTLRNYDPKSGRIASIKTTNSVKIQDLSYQWRSDGSLESRINSKSIFPITDTFSYDNLDRLTETITSIGAATQRSLTQTYNNLGNIKSNISSRTADVQVTGYLYGTTVNAGPHAVTGATINGVSYSLGYDKNGAIETYDAAGSTPDKFIAYNAANQPIKITVGASLNDANPNARDEFRYTPDGARYYKKSTYKEGNRLRVEHTFYIEDYETTYYDTFSALKQTEKTQIGSSILNIRKTPYSGVVTTKLEVLHRDHLGSVDAVTAGSTKVIDLAFEPFGGRRSSGLLANISASEMTDLLVKSDVLNSQGFTGHEGLDRTGFIHMNGRVYDPQLGRFLSPDPLISNPLNSQSWNRYSYVSNNPLKYTDPTGFAQICKEQKACVDEIVVTGRKDPGYDGGKMVDKSFLDFIPTNNRERETDVPKEYARIQKIGDIAADASVVVELYNEGISTVLLGYTSLVSLPVEAAAWGGAAVSASIAKWGLTLSESKIFLKTAQGAYRGSTVAGHALSKHAGRAPEVWGKMTGSMKTWNQQAMSHIRDIVRGPGQFEKITTDKGLNFVEKRIDDGRGIRLNMDYTFKGFVE